VGEKFRKIEFAMTAKEHEGRKRFHPFGAFSRSFTVLFLARKVRWMFGVSSTRRQAVGYWGIGLGMAMSSRQPAGAGKQDFPVYTAQHSLPEL
jgi:hypothetical protein